MPSVTVFSAPVLPPSPPVRLQPYSLPSNVRPIAKSSPAATCTNLMPFTVFSADCAASCSSARATLGLFIKPNENATLKINATVIAIDAKRAVKFLECLVDFISIVNPSLKMFCRKSR